MKACRQRIHLPIIDDWNGTGLDKQEFERLRLQLHHVGSKVLELVSAELNNPMDAYFCLSFVRQFIRDQYKLKKTESIDQVLAETDRPWKP